MFPPTCALCGAFKRGLRATKPVCRRCIVKLDTIRAAGALPQFRHAGHYTVGPYSGVLRKAIVRIKFHGDLRLARVLAGWLAQSIDDFTAWDVVVPMPCRFRSFLRRGFHLPLEIARQLQRHRPAIRVETRLLLMLHGRRYQTKLRRGARAANVAGAFRCRSGISGLRVLLVDDVVTTGATSQAAAQALLAAGAERVEFAYLARWAYFRPTQNMASSTQ